MMITSQQTSQSSSQGLKILGIDPGSWVTGYALIEPVSTHRRNQFQISNMGTLRPPKTLSYLERLAHMHNHLHELLSQHKPTHGVFESAYVGHHPQSAIKLSETRGVLLAAAFQHPLKVHEMTAPTAKKAITGKGSTSKKEVALILRSFFPSSSVWQSPQGQDATDALALALAFGLTIAIKDALGTSYSKAP